MADVFTSMYFLIKEMVMPEDLKKINNQAIIDKFGENTTVKKNVITSDKVERRNQITEIIVIIALMITFIVSCTCSYLAYHHYSKSKPGVRIAWTVLAFFGSWVFILLHLLNFDVFYNLN